MSGETAHLTLPTDGGRSTRALYKRLLRKMARDALAMPEELVGGDVAQSTLPVARQIADEHASAVFKALRRPHVHGLLNCMFRALTDQEIDEGKRLARAFQLQLMAELALDGALSDEVIWSGDAPMGALVSPAHRFHASLDDVRAITFRPGGLVLDRDGAGAEMGPGNAADSFLAVTSHQVLALVDNNPISDFEAHPDKEGNQLSCGEADPEAWGASIAEALGRVETYLPELRQEMDVLLQQFVPVGTDDNAHLSASYRELIGHVYLTLHPRQMTMTEAVIHEYQHNKINMLFHVDLVMENAFHPLYPSPVRPDPRPLHGVLLAAHAFVPVAELYARMVRADDPECGLSGFDRRFKEIIASNEEAVAVLREHAEPTDAGREVLDELFAIHETHMALHG